MKKVLLALVIVMSMISVSCSLAESNARKEIEKRCDALIKERASYSIGKCIYSADNDSCFIFSGETVGTNGERSDTEFLYRQTEDNLLIGIKLVEFYGSLLRNMDVKANTGNNMDEIINAAFQSSGLGLSVTIYDDLQNGSLIDITNTTSKK